MDGDPEEGTWVAEATLGRTLRDAVTERVEEIAVMVGAELPVVVNPTGASEVVVDADVVEVEDVPAVLCR